MLHLFAGEDTQGKRASYDRFMISLPEGTEIFHIEGKNFDRAQVESFYSGAGLFFKRCAVVLEDILERKEEAEFLFANLEKMSSSENIFIFLERKMSKPVLDEFKRSGAELNVFELEKKKENGAKFNGFVLANSLGERNKLSLWLNFCRAREAGMELDPLAGILFWKVKDMLLRRSFGKFSEKELKELAGKISALLPKARKEGRDPEAAFEEFLLEAF